jgi:23S rRNA (cytosine1962-C5)-methyltransferase
MVSYPRVTLRKGKEEPVKRFHPWIFSGAIDHIERKLNDGDLVDVYSNNGSYLATGHFHNSSIAVKLLTWEKQEIGPDFWRAKLAEAYNLRSRVGLTNNSATNCYRLIHNEGDWIPGLIIDMYAGTAVLQAHSMGMYRSRSEIAAALQSVYQGKLKAVFDKSAESLKKNTGIKVENELLWGKAEAVEVLENNCRFSVDIESGQKTGFFLDQRDNRQLLGSFAGGCKVLNMFSYTGGFSVYALKAGAEYVHSVDSSVPACEMAEKNAGLNGFSHPDHQVFVMDARHYLETMKSFQYNLIILDPPAYAKNVGSRHHAIKGYTSLNASAFRKIAPGGILFTFSCSQVVDRQQFTSAVAAAAIESGRKVKILHQLGQPADHPVNIFQPEGEYLKGLVLRVE